MLMTPRAHCLGLIIFSVFILAVHGLPTPGLRIQGSFVTIIDKEFRAVHKRLKPSTRKQITLAVQQLLNPQEVYYHTKVKTDATSNGPLQMVTRFVVQGSPLCNKNPCFAWIHPTDSVKGSIFSLNAHGKWDRVRSNLKKFQWANPQFEETQASWVTKWNEVTWRDIKEWKETHTDLGIERKDRIKIPDEYIILVGQNASPRLSASPIGGPSSSKPQKQNTITPPADRSRSPSVPVPESARHKAGSVSKSLTPEPPSPQHNPIVPGITLFNRPLNGHPDFRKQEVQGDSGLPKISKDPSYDPFVGHDPEDPYSLSLRGHQ
ncbi:hypothetical protein BDP27DRAFT_1331090 [Rhodocollybia butyracea]|uniref:Uncharacterized protein n=1 Tax=Rhodocollybia butyracea TaxID=206335 RepID=A0A9P5PPG2_9AGAR|nr:hypothetical protein BDP27DRAFT_1331090 [Rhodocollybia butyracea]